MKRIFRLNLKNGEEIDLNLVKATAIKADIGMLHLDKISDKGYRLIISEDIIKDISQLKTIEIIREDDEGLEKLPDYIKVPDVCDHYMRRLDKEDYKYYEDSTGWTIKVKYEGGKVYVNCPNAPTVHNNRAYEVSYDDWKEHHPKVKYFQ